MIDSGKTRLAIVVSHPIQYYVPVFRALASSDSIEPRVFYTWSDAAGGQVFDSGFGAVVAWDIPLLSGYESQFVPNVAGRSGVEHFGGLDNPSLTSDIESWRADALLIYGWNSKTHLGAMRYFSGRIPVLFRGDSTLLDPISIGRRLLRWALLRWVYSHVDTAVAVGSNSRDYFSWCGLPPDRIAFAPHCVEVARFSDEASGHESRAANWRKELGIKPTEIAFLYAGKLQPKKDPALLLKAFRSLATRCHLIYVGAGELEHDLKQEAAGLDTVHFIPFQNQQMMPTVYRIGDLFVLPSRGPGETWGLALNEAMACGRPVLASTRVGGARDLIQPGKTGWTFAAGDGEALRASLDNALQGGREGLAAMGATSRSVIERWSPEESANGIAQAVMRACANR